MRRRYALSAADLAKAINGYVDRQQYFWACGLIRETLSVWREPQNMGLLHEDAQVIARHYLANGT